MKWKTYIFIGILLLCIPLSYYGYKFGRAIYFRNQFQIICYQADLVAKGIEGIIIEPKWYIPGEHNYLNGRLTTPVAYLNEIPSDPFSKTNEPYRYLNETKYKAPNPYLLISQGPDGDWDMENYSVKTTLSIPVLITYPINIMKFSNQTAQDYSKQVVNYGHDWEYDVEYYERNGNRFFVPLYTYWTLTTYLRTWEDCIQLLGKDGVAIYDPSNGLYSNGDIVIFNQVRTFYSEYTDKLLF